MDINEISMLRYEPSFNARLPLVVLQSLLWRHLAICQSYFSLYYSTYLSLFYITSRLQTIPECCCVHNAYGQLLFRLAKGDSNKFVL
jgi:hypothetical protein